MSGLAAYARSRNRVAGDAKLATPLPENKVAPLDTSNSTAPTPDTDETTSIDAPRGTSNRSSVRELPFPTVSGDTAFGAIDVLMLIEP